MNGPVRVHHVPHHGVVVFGGRHRTVIARRQTPRRYLSYAAGRKPLTISPTPRATSNSPPGIDRATPDVERDQFGEVAECEDHLAGPAPPAPLRRGPDPP